MTTELILPSAFGVASLLIGLVLLAVGVVFTVLVFRDARRRGASDGIAALAAAACVLTAPLGFIVYAVLAATGLADSIVESLEGSGDRPGTSARRADGPQPPPAGWYDDPEGPGQRWWDGTAWTEHRQGAD